MTLPPPLFLTPGQVLQQCGPHRLRAHDGAPRGRHSGTRGIQAQTSLPPGIHGRLGLHSWGWFPGCSRGHVPGCDDRGRVPGRESAVGSAAVPAAVHLPRSPMVSLPLCFPDSSSHRLALQSLFCCSLTLLPMPSRLSWTPLSFGQVRRYPPTHPHPAPPTPPHRPASPSPIHPPPPTPHNPPGQVRRLRLLPFTGPTPCTLAHFAILLVSLTLNPLSPSFPPLPPPGRCADFAAWKPLWTPQPPPYPGASSPGRDGNPPLVGGVWC
jgi:hypothetical protein